MTDSIPPNQPPNPRQQCGQQPPNLPQTFAPPLRSQMPYQQQQPQQQWQPSYPPQPVVSPKSPAAGLIVSIFLPGVGSMMAGKVGKGVGILLGYILGAILTIFIVGIIIAIPLWIWGMVAGYQDAVAWNRAHGIIS
jgi:TM2 domain-containing membrane protein YozV